jgi:ERCC4-type nuclease
MFHSIFSKKETNANSNKIKPKIIADIHEKNSLIFGQLKSDKDIELQVQPLKIGDYQIGETIIERKTINDLVSSMISKRLLEQLNQMRQYEKKLLIIEGEISEIKNTKINPNAIRGFILSIITNHNIPIIFTNNYQDTSKYLIILAKQQLKPKTEISLHSRIPKTREEQKEYILQAFPNIGPKKSEELIKKFHSLNNVFNASEKDLNEILKNQSKDFKNLLNF